MGEALPQANEDRRSLNQTEPVEASIASSLLDNGFCFHPLVDTNTGVVYGYQVALSSSQNAEAPTLGEIYDMAFETEKLPDLEMEFLRQSVERFKGLGPAKGTKLYVNFDGRELGFGEDPRTELATLFRELDLSPNSVVLELSNAAQKSACEVTQHSLEQIRQSGVQVALPNFGRGGAELKQLHDQAPDFVKVDRFILNGIESDPRKRLFLSSVVSLARVLGSRIIAEGVETEQEFKICRDAGCDLIQGPHVSAPVHRRIEARLFYDHIRSATQHEKKRGEEQIMRRELVPAQTIGFDATIKDVLNVVIANQEYSVIPVLDENYEPRGLVHERDLKAYLYTSDVEDEDRDAALDMPLRGFVRSCPIADIDSDADTLLVTFAASLQSDGIIITENFRYAGFLSATSLLKIIHEKRLQEAQDQNPLTRLPGNAAVARYLTDVSRKTGRHRHVCYLDFDNFKPFNDRYGFPQGDRAILMFSQLLQRLINGEGSFHGHIGGDDFFVGFIGGSKEEVLDQMNQLKKTFRKDIESLYSQEDRERGHIISTDRFGVEREFPLLDCSISVLTIPEDLALHTEQINREIALLKGAAKRAKTGLVSKTLIAG